MLNNFITGLMRSAGTVMFFAGMAFLAYAVVGGYYHYSPLLHAVAWGFAGWVLFFFGMNLVQQYPAQQQSVALPAPPQMVPSHEHPQNLWQMGPATRKEAREPWTRAENNSDNGRLRD